MRPRNCLGAGTLAICAVFVSVAWADTRGNRLTYLNVDSPYYVSGEFPKLTTPMWVGEAEVELAVVPSIDDLREVESHVVAAARLSADARPELAGPIVDGMIRGADDRRRAAIIALRELPSAMIGNGVASLLDGLNSRLTAFLEN
jgi:hypothetical protein